MINRPVLVVYVAGASSEFLRARKCMRALQKEGAIVPYDWTQSVEAAHKSGQKDTALPEETRTLLATQCVSGVEDADMVWALAPLPPHTSSGLWFEFGIAKARRKMTVVSGAWGQSLFTNLADRKFSSDEDALSHILTVFHGRRLLLAGKINGDSDKGF